MDDKRQLGEGGKLEPSLKQSIGLGLVLFSLNVCEAHFKKENSNNKVKSSLSWANRPGASRAKSWVSPRSYVVVPWETVDHRDSVPWRTVNPGGQWTVGGVDGGSCERVDHRDCAPWGTVSTGGQWTLGDSANDFACPEVYLSLLCTEFSLLALQCILWNKDTCLPWNPHLISEGSWVYHFKEPPTLPREFRE